MEQMACTNRGYFVHISNLADVQEKVQVMNKSTNERMNKRANERMYEQINEWMKKWVNWFNE